jgi:Flp pilus assembly protein TadB
MLSIAFVGVLIFSCNTAKKHSDLGNIDQGIVLRHTVNSFDHKSDSTIAHQFKQPVDSFQAMDKINLVKSINTVETSEMVTHSPKEIPKRVLRKIKRSTKLFPESKKSANSNGGATVLFIIVVVLFILFLNWLGISWGRIVLYLLLGILLGLILAAGLASFE